MAEEHLKKCSTSILSFCPLRQEHTQDNRNLLWQKLYCLLLQEEESEWQNPVPFMEIVLRLGRVAP